ncbi:MAG: hypothetical protein RL091_2378 [Verrucomicrobiota bacterium]|jgi:CRP/FNR family transcriptional regulator, cyclic AMP receptor protein
MDLAILQTLPRLSLPAGHVLIEEAAPIRKIFFLESGEVEVIKGGTLISEVYDAGAVFGDMAFLLQSLPMATVRTTTPSVFREVDDPAGFFRQHPEVSLHVAIILARRVDALSRYLVDIKNQFKDRADHLGMIDEVLDTLIHKHPRAIPRRSAGD